MLLIDVAVLCPNVCQQGQYVACIPFLVHYSDLLLICSAGMLLMPTPDLRLFACFPEDMQGIKHC